ncbi:MAG: LVIVD repeat-containing protein [Gemmatimonadales bacterium]
MSRHVVLALHLSIAAALIVTVAPGAAAQNGSAPVNPASSDARVGLRAGKYDAAEAAWNMRLLSATKPSEKFVNGINSDLAFTGHYAIQGSFNGYQIWDLTNPSHPTLRTSYFCPASQSDVSVYKNLLIVSAESPSARLDCGAEGVTDTVSAERLRGIRIFDISDLDHPKYVTSVQTCRGSHTHSLLVDPKDKANVYVYISGSAPVRSPTELPGCNTKAPATDANSPLMRIEIIKIPLAHPERAARVSSARIFQGLKAPPTHGQTLEDSLANVKLLADARAHGGFIARIDNQETVLGSRFVDPALDSIVKARGGTGAPTAADSAALRGALQGLIDKLIGANSDADPMAIRQCHDITLDPSIGLAGGACEGHGLLLDIHDPAHPIRLDAVDDKNFSYWHSATFNNDGTKVLFSDEWGGGGAPKCRASDPREWGADALFTIDANKKLHFQSYYKLPAPQTSAENCVAHNGSLIPIPGRDVMVQSWYQGGVSVFDWTDVKHPTEIAYFDRGPLDSTRMILGGTWSAYWYNGVIVSSEITRGLDVFELTPSDKLSQNEIDAAKTVHLDYLNVQDQPKFTWPATFSLARAYTDQLERSNGLSAARVGAVRKALVNAEQASGAARSSALTRLASSLDADARGSRDAAKVRTLAGAVRALAK